MSIARPKHIPEKEWKYAVERAQRAAKHAKMFDPPDDMSIFNKFEHPMWQWENEVKGRFSGVVGGNLKQRSFWRTEAVAEAN